MHNASQDAAREKPSYGACTLMPQAVSDTAELHCIPKAGTVPVEQLQLHLQQLRCAAADATAAL
jgi:hypothetical protein